MRKLLLAALVMGAVAVTSLPGNAAADRVVNATIIAPTAVQGAPNGGIGCADFSNPFCYKNSVVVRHARCLYTIDPASAQDATTGKLGYVVTLAAADKGRPFTLRDTTGLPAPAFADFDITFYESLGQCEGGPIAADLELAPGPVAIEPDPHFTHFGNEAGTVPSRANVAIITLFGGANSKFRLTVDRL